MNVEKYDFKVGDKVRLTGGDWLYQEHAVSTGDVVEITHYFPNIPGYEYSGVPGFSSDSGEWYVYYSENEDGYVEDFRGELVEAAQ